jgi:hypothetical protein
MLNGNINPISTFYSTRCKVPNPKACRALELVLKGVMWVRICLGDNNYSIAKRRKSLHVCTDPPTIGCDIPLSLFGMGSIVENVNLCDRIQARATKRKATGANGSGTQLKAA